MHPLAPAPSRTLHDLARRSIDLITSLQTPEGAYPASPTFSAYRGYCWLRDGSFTADAVSAAGRGDSADAFHRWCAGVIERRGDEIVAIVAETRAGRPPRGERMMPARFTFAGDDGTDPWWDFQLDGYGTWLWALAEHLDRHGGSGEPYRTAVALTAEYLLVSWRRPCYDWWEEYAQHVHVSTLGCILAGLDAAARVGLVDDDLAGRIHQEATDIRAVLDRDSLEDGRLVKWLGADGVDGSLAALLAPLGVVDPCSEVGRRTLAALEARLVVDDGVHRYLGDTFYGGGRWPLLSCFLGLAHLAAGDEDRAAELLDWAVSTATADLELPEQVDGHLIAPGMRQEWVDRWGTVATPLVWSHAMVLRLGIALGRVDPVELAEGRTGGGVVR